VDAERTCVMTKFDKTSMLISLPSPVLLVIL
jgi:hypothetical protein